MHTHTHTHIVNDILLSFLSDRVDTNCVIYLSFLTAVPFSVVTEGNCLQTQAYNYGMYVYMVEKTSLQLSIV